MDSSDDNPAILGIEPGLDGAAAWSLPGRAEALLTLTLPPVKTGRRPFDEAAIFDLLKVYPADLAVIEAVSVAPMDWRAQSTTSMFGLERGLEPRGRIQDSLAIPHQAFTPQARTESGVSRTSRRQSPPPGALPGRLALADPMLPGPERRLLRRDLPGRDRRRILAAMCREPTTIDGRSSRRSIDH